MALRTTSSKVLVFSVIVIAASAIMVLLFRFSGSPDPAPELTPVGSTDFPDAPAAPARRDAGAAADTPEETVQALASGQTALESRIGEVTDQVQSGMLSMSDQVRELMDEIRGLRQAQSEQQARDEAEKESLKGELLASMENMVDGLESRIRSEYPVTGGPAAETFTGQIGADGLVWHSARGPDPVGEGDGAFGAFPALAGSLPGLPGTDNTLLGPLDDGPPPPEPVYTIPAEATLVRSRGLTALIGRVPAQGQVQDPFPFKVITGPDNLLANGQVLPEIVQSIWTGTAVGDRTLHCVSGTVHQVTFIFPDGTIRTWPDREEGGVSNLGWISDEQGYPCIPGRFVSNIEEIIGKLSASSFASGLTEAWAERQVTTTVEGQAITRAVTGDPVDFALARGASRGINEWARIMAERAQDAFDVVVVRPGRTLSIHVNRAIPIDWPREDARRVRHVASGQDVRTRPGGLD